MTFTRHFDNWDTDSEGCTLRINFILHELNHIENMFLRHETKLNTSPEHYSRYAISDGTLQSNDSVRALEVADIDRYTVIDDDDGDSSDSSDTSSESSLEARLEADFHDPSELSSLYNHDQNLILRAPVASEDLKRAQSLLETLLPEDYLTFLQLTNGLNSFPSHSDPGLRSVTRRDWTRQEVDRKASSRFYFYNNNQGPCWQNLDAIDPSCPARTWHLDHKTMLLISNRDSDSYVWLVTPNGMAQIKSSRSGTNLHSPGLAQRNHHQQSFAESGWGVLRWYKNVGPGDTGDLQLYESFLEYLVGLLKAMKIAYGIETME